MRLISRIRATLSPRYRAQLAQDAVIAMYVYDLTRATETMLANSQQISAWNYKP